jgi:glycosyltransferase involved in cell wall biosynthesis
MSDKPLVSVVITNYNYEKYIKACVESCLPPYQTWPRVYVTVVDDASTDGSNPVLRALEIEHDDDMRVEVLRQMENHGYSRAKNRGIEDIKGDFIAILDADDMLTRESIQWRVEYLLARPEVDVVYGWARELRTDADPAEAEAVRKTLRHHPSKINSQTVMYRRRVFEKYGLFYEGLRSKADKEFYFRLGIHPESPLPKLVKCKGLDADLAYYRKHEGQMHKLRKADPAISKQVEHDFKARIKQLKREGITHENTRFMP